MRGQPEFSDDILEMFAKREAQTIDIPVIQPADSFLDMAGEDLRRRIFLTENENGQSLCLRPEFTIPVCQRHIDINSGTPRRYAYLGQVFRQRRNGDNEFFQSGIEDLGNDNISEADAHAVRDATDTLAMLLPDIDLRTTLGDQTVFEAVVAALGLPAGWQTRLIRAFGDPGQLDMLLRTLSKPAGGDAGLEADVSALARDADQGALIAHIDQHMRRTGYLSHASRTPTEIADRLISKTRLSNAHLDARPLEILKTFLALEVTLTEAPAALRDFALDAGLDLTDALASFDGRVAALQKCGCDIAVMHYRAAFGRPLDYYTGLVFEISANGSVLAGGGRYDRLLTLLGATAPIPAVGFSLWLDRIELAHTGAAGEPAS
jgi:ATP phosphoribosyltransferase regulatory subunit